MHITCTCITTDAKYIFVKGLQSQDGLYIYIHSTKLAAKRSGFSVLEVNGTSPTLSQESYVLANETFHSPIQYTHGRADDYISL